MRRKGTPPAPDPGEQALAARRLREIAFVLPFVGLALITPPIIHIFADSRTVFGIPIIILYIFGVWAALVLSAFRLARRLREEGDR
ncbi:hypothetical protein [Oceanibacterium hippocampi]|uniref:Uncharacterized protein n=1 Tax=Oceanibacterium hippocampi TaxID=745714 RepID=A0A1Y5TXK1_9PROT|nr:hypothetical protein [Oceanibacterium hippocampi]SLN75806.1 hypothetical protein OCH7691_03969 [Oceanibacterium hippocampi]